jgi:hypothetical protein
MRRYLLTLGLGLLLGGILLLGVLVARAFGSTTISRDLVSDGARPEASELVLPT